jgi:hypothetical protein
MNNTPTLRDLIVMAGNGKADAILPIYVQDHFALEMFEDSSTSLPCPGKGYDDA